jgi:hypothetical protein
MPLIMQAQQQDMPFEQDPYEEEEEGSLTPPSVIPTGQHRLSIITEKTEERTIDSRLWGPASQQSLFLDPSAPSLGVPRRQSARPMSAITGTTMDYGNVICESGTVCYLRSSTD